MKVYDKIKDMLCDELEGIAKKNELTTNSLDVIYKSVDILKDISTIHAMEQEYGSEGYSSEGYSRDGYSQGGYYGRMPYYMYDDGMSHGRGANAPRDSRGRYTSDYSRDGYSGDTKDELRQIMNRASNERDREAIRMALDSMGK